jgi:hypothetical protein
MPTDNIPRRLFAFAMVLAFLLNASTVTVSAYIPHYCDPVGEYDSIVFMTFDGDDPEASAYPFEVECQDRSGVGPFDDMNDWHFGNSAGDFQGTDNDKTESIAFRGRSGEKFCVTVFEHAGPPPYGGEDWTYSVVGATTKAVNLPASIDNRVSAYEMWRAQSTTASCLPHTYNYNPD